MVIGFLNHYLNDMFDIIKPLYQKNGLKEKYEMFELLWVISILIQDKNLLPIIRVTMPSMFKSDPTKIMYILYSEIPQKSHVPKFNFKKPKEETVNKLMQNLTKYFGWSKKEVGLYKELIEEN